MTHEQIKTYTLKETGVAFLGLFGSVSTLICCALPALFVALGMGATVAGITSNFPWLVTLSQHKDWLFTGSFLMLSASALMQYMARNAPCPIDPKARAACIWGRKLSIWATGVSFLLWGIGFVVAYFPSVIFFIF
jgi:hypothetical protein